MLTFRENASSYLVQTPVSAIIYFKMFIILI